MFKCRMAEKNDFSFFVAMNLLILNQQSNIIYFLKINQDFLILVICFQNINVLTYGLKFLFHYPSAMINKDNLSRFQLHKMIVYTLFVSISKLFRKNNTLRKY